MLTPFYRLVCCRSWGERNLKVVLAASGSFIYCFNQSNGAVLSKWSQADPHGSAPSVGSRADDEPAERPAKRRRTSQGDEEEASDRSPDVITLNESAEKPRRRKRRVPAQPSVVKLIVAKTGRHVVAVTDEDKSVRVLEMLDGSLRQVSERQMPKKPNAICFSPDESTLLVGDKFGDVYSIPLLVSSNPETSENVPKVDTDVQTPEVEAEPEIVEAKAFKPSANLKTIHTKKNRIALENQMRSKQAQGPKKGIEFEHKLLLGHVSLLTDIAYVNCLVKGKERGYILTSDRDEKVRVSRGEPESHIIEGFCMGHTDFVNRILVPPTLPHLLVTGGGEDKIFIWDWLSADLVTKMSLAKLVNVADASGQQVDRQIAIIGLYAMQVGDEDDSTKTMILILSEALPALIFVTISTSANYDTINYLPLRGNPLDLAIDPETCSILVSVDPIHDVGKTVLSNQDQNSDLSDPESSVQMDTDVSKLAKHRPYLQSFQLLAPGELREIADNGKAADERSFASLAWNLNHWSYSREQEVENAALSELLYGVEHLRKRTGGTGNRGGKGEAEGEDEGVEEVEEESVVDDVEE